MNKKPTSRPAVKVRARVWLDAGTRPGLTDAGADLLEQIAATGSLSAAARRLRFSYRRAWMLLDAMNRAWEEPLATTATGGRGGGGARLTDLGRAVLSSYRHIQLELEHFLDQQGPALERMVNPHRA